MKNFFTTKNIAKTAMVAAIYGALTFFIAPFAYGPIQFRITEVMVLLAFIDFGYVPGLVLGCVIANLFSPIGIADVVFGSFATFIAVIMVSKTKNLLLATLWPSIVNGLIIAIELYLISKLPFWLSFGEVALGEFIVVTCIGYPVFRSLLKDERLVRFLKFD